MLRFQHALPLILCSLLASLVNLVLLWGNRLVTIGLLRYYDEIFSGDNLPGLTKTLILLWWWPGVLSAWFLLIVVLTVDCPTPKRCMLALYLISWTFLIELILLLLLPYVYYLPWLRT